MRAAVRYIAMFFFNLLPLVMVGAGVWSPFGAMAFYWVELIAVAVFTILKFLIALIYDFYHHAYQRVAGCLIGLILFPIHYGFAIVMMCFLVGSFLPPDTPTRILDSPLVPMQVVMENIPFTEMLVIALCWQAVYFFTDFLIPRAYENQSRESYTMRPYATLAALFFSGFAGVLIAAQQGGRIWGAIILTATKTLISFFETRQLLKEEAERDKAL